MAKMMNVLEERYSRSMGFLPGTGTTRVDASLFGLHFMFSAPAMRSWDSRVKRKEWMKIDLSGHCKIKWCQLDKTLEQLYSFGIRRCKNGGIIHDSARYQGSFWSDHLQPSLRRCGFNQQRFAARRASAIPPLLLPDNQGTIAHA